MKGPNPFALYEEDPENISGRKDESKIFNGFVEAALSKQGAVLALVGAPGVGKTMLMRSFRHSAEKAGLFCPLVKAEKGEGEPDLLAKISQDAMLPKAEGGLENLAKALERAGHKGHFGAIIFIDGIDLARKHAEIIQNLVNEAKAGWGKRNLGFVVSSMEGIDSSELLSVVRLKPFDEHDAREWMDKALKKGPPKMGEECLQSLLNDTGGNPKLLKIVCRIIYERLRDNEKVISKGHYLGYLPQIMSALSREWFGEAYQETPAAERKILQALAKSEDGANVSDVARTLGKPLGPVTALTRRLLDRGQITKVDRGRYKAFSRLYARYVNQRASNQSRTP